MSFEEEWAQVREGAAERQDSEMRLNSAGASPGRGSGQPELRTNDPGKAGAVKAVGRGARGQSFITGREDAYSALRTRK